MIEDSFSWTSPRRNQMASLQQTTREKNCPFQDWHRGAMETVFQSKMLNKFWALCCGDWFYVIRVGLLTTFAILEDIFQGYSGRDVGP